MRLARAICAPVSCALIALLATATICAADWQPGGIPVPGGGSPHTACSDGQGGVYIGWRDGRNTVTRSDVYMTRMTPAGTVAPGFPPLALPICTSPDDQNYCGIALDTLGDAFVEWDDFRDAGAERGPRLYASRVTPDGQIAPGWPIDGLKVGGPMIGSQACGAPVPDSEGGAYFLWNDYRSGNSDVYVQRITANGVPATGWPLYGLPGATGTGLEDQTFYGNSAVTDRAGGVIFAYGDGRADAPGIYVQRVTPSGAISPGWPAGGLRISPFFAFGTIVPDGSGGAYASLGVPFQPSLLTVSTVIRVTAGGQIAPGWVFGGNVICDTTYIRLYSLLASDQAGNVFANWDDYRNQSYSVIYAVRLNPDGTFAPGWRKNGRRISTLNTAQFSRSPLADGIGGVYAAFESQTSSAGDYAMIQHLDADGSPAPGWTSDGANLNPTEGQIDPRLAPDGSGGAYVVWVYATANGGLGALYIQHYLNDGVVATELSLVSAEATPDDVTLLWQSASAQGLAAAVYRRTGTTPWQALGTPTLEAPDRLRFVDRSVVPSTRYAYRLGYEDGGAEQFTQEAWVDVPAPRLALDGLRPNPATGPMAVSFSLPNTQPAALEVLDVTGRRIAQREVGSLGAGSHVLQLTETSAIRPGIYWLRLRQGNRTLMARGAVVR